MLWNSPAHRFINAGDWQVVVSINIQQSCELYRGMGEGIDWHKWLYFYWDLHPSFCSRSTCHSWHTYYLHHNFAYNNGIV